MRQSTRVQRSTLISKLTTRKTTSNLPSTPLEQEKEKFKWVWSVLCNMVLVMEKISYFCGILALETFRATKQEKWTKTILLYITISLLALLLEFSTKMPSDCRHWTYWGDRKPGDDLCWRYWRRHWWGKSKFLFIQILIWGRWTESRLHNSFHPGGGCVTQCKISELMENSNIQRNELTCSQPSRSTLSRFWPLSKC